MHEAHDHAPHEHAGDAMLLMELGLGVLVALGLALLALYLLAVVRQHRRAARWSGWRVASFTIGVALILVALLPPVARLAHADLRIHMVQHLLLGMLGPIAIVLGAPLTLALRSLPPPTARAVVRRLHSAPLRLLAHPAVALVLNIGGMAVLYLTPLYAAMGAQPVLHVAVHAHFVAAGTLFAWAIAGAEPAAPRASLGVRLVVVFLAIAAHGVVSKAMYAYGLPRGTHHAQAEIEDAAQIMFYGGDLAELLLIIALLTTASARSVRRFLRLDAVGGPC